MGLGIGCSDGEGGSTATLNSLDAGSGGPACENGRKDPIETDVDCGGGCRLKCAVGKHCGSNRDCETNLCIDDMCVAPSCTDGIKNGLEIDVDCGGTCPNKCKNGQRCAQAQDCEDGFCQIGQCRAPGCGDGIKNGTESDVDCGGACAPCANARSCNVDIDCQSGACSSAKCIVKPMLSSITPSYAATGGGSKISFTGTNFVNVPGVTAQFGTATVAATWVSSTSVYAFAPAAPAGTVDVSILGMPGGALTLPNALIYVGPGCTDGIKSGTETDVDCGGPCAKCANGLSCTVDGDCQSGACSNTKCSVKPTLTSISPSYAATGGGTKISFTGTNFVNVPGFTAQFGTSTVAATYVSTTSVYAFAPAAPAGTVDVSILGMPGGTLTLANALVYTDNPPVDLTFGSAVTSYSYAPAGSLAVGDVNNDGKIDYVQDHGGSHFDMRINSTTTSFSMSNYTSVGGSTSSPRRTILADVNGDLKADLLDTEGNSLVVRLSAGTSFTAPPSAPTYATSTTPEGLVAADFNGDTKLDVAVIHSGADVVDVFINKGDGTGALNAAVPYTAPRGTRIAAADFNADGYSDLVTSDSVNSKVNVLLNNKDGTFAAAVPYTLTAPSAGVAIGDVDNDGKLDIVVANGAKVSTLRGVGNGTFLDAVDTTIPGATTIPVLRVADLSGDNKADLVLLNTAANQIEIWLSNTGGSFISASKTFAMTGPTDLQLADLNVDGKLDVVYSGSSGVYINLRQ